MLIKGKKYRVKPSCSMDGYLTDDVVIAIEECEEQLTWCVHENDYVADFEDEEDYYGIGVSPAPFLESELEVV